VTGTVRITASPMAMAGWCSGAPRRSLQHPTGAFAGRWAYGRKANAIGRSTGLAGGGTG